MLRCHLPPPPPNSKFKIFSVSKNTILFGQRWEKRGNRRATVHVQGERRNSHMHSVVTDAGRQPFSADKTKAAFLSPWQSGTRPKPMSKSSIGIDPRDPPIPNAGRRLINATLAYSLLLASSHDGA